VRVVMVSHSFRAAARPWSRHHVRVAGSAWPIGVGAAPKASWQAAESTTKGWVNW